MHDTIVILAADYREGRRFAADIGLTMSAIVPVDASRLRGLRPSIILELPSYATRRDRHAMEAVMQRAYKKVGAPVIEMFIEDPESFRPGVVQEDPNAARPEPLPVDEIPGQTSVYDELAQAELDRLRRVDATLTAGHSSAVQVAADAPKTEAAETPPKPGYKPRSRKRT